MQSELQHINLTIPADLGQVERLSARIEQLFEQAYALPSTEPEVYNIVLAVQEVAVNIVQHAYADSTGESEIDVEIVLNRAPASITITLGDRGRPFAPEAIADPELGTLQEHGYGLFLVRQLMDRVDYQTSDSGNRWILYKDLSSLSHTASIDNSRHCK